MTNLVLSIWNHAITVGDVILFAVLWFVVPWGVRKLRGG